MNTKEFVILVEEEGWEYVLRNVRPSKLKDAGLAEALLDTQEAFRVLVEMTPEYDILLVEDEEFDDEDSLELNFDD